MEGLPRDAVQILIGNLNTTIQAIRSTSVSLRTTVDVVLSNDLTYKLLIEGLLVIKLPDRLTSWKTVYTFLTDIMGIEKHVVNEDMRIRNARAIITLLYNDTTKGLISDEDRATASRVPL